MVIKLHHFQMQVICTHAESTYPDECCGIILGQITDDSKTLVEVRETANAWSAETDYYPGSELVLAKTSRYAISPAVMLQLQQEARDRQLDIIGIYHSHPDHAATPSEFDRVIAWYQYSYIIVSVQNGKACELLSWTLDHHHHFQPEEIVTITT